MEGRNKLNWLERVTQTEGWHTLNLLPGRVTQTHFTLILSLKWADLPEILIKPNSLWIICISTQWWLLYVKILNEKSLNSVNSVLHTIILLIEIDICILHSSWIIIVELMENQLIYVFFIKRILPQMTHPLSPSLFVSPYTSSTAIRDTYSLSLFLDQQQLKESLQVPLAKRVPLKDGDETVKKKIVSIHCFSWINICSYFYINTQPILQLCSSIPCKWNQ